MATETKFTQKQKIGCFLLVLAVFIRIPLAYAGSILLYMHVDAPPYLWVILWVSLPLIILLEIGFDLLKAGFLGKDE